MPYYQSALHDQHQYELTFSDLSLVLIAANDTVATYAISNICFVYDSLVNENIALLIENQYIGYFTVLYGNVIRKSNT